MGADKEVSMIEARNIQETYNEILSKERKLFLWLITAIGSSAGYVISTQIGLDSNLIDFMIVSVILFIYFTEHSLLPNPGLNQKILIITVSTLFWSSYQVIGFKIDTNIIMSLTLYQVIFSYFVLKSFLKKKKNLILEIDKKVAELNPQYVSEYQ
ncbi:hypothetical protein [Psychromonas aquatilis]|uniref:Uncharacterized protein n=1 Tax=Psychromonas aquatilis TaxID=2005072 RepID=A0ABU9GLA8_9GAMM